MNDFLHQLQLFGLEMLALAILAVVAAVALRHLLPTPTPGTRQPPDRPDHHRPVFPVRTGPKPVLPPCNATPNNSAPNPTPRDDLADFTATPLAEQIEAELQQILRESS